MAGPADRGSAVRPGEFRVILGGPLDALRARSEGFQVRDTLLVLLPGRRVLTAFLCRRPLEGTVAENVLKHGVGGLWIDGCRVVTGDDLNGGAYSAGGRAAPMTGDGRTGASLGMFEPGRGAGEYKQPTGRWPTNLVLVHGPGCVRIGEKVVPKGGGDGLASRTRRANGPEAFGRRYEDREPRISHYKGGLETVAAWACQPDCPVRIMDEQSGDRVSGMMVAGQTRKDSYGKGGYHDGFVTAASEHGTYGDAGGASRFYPQFTDLASALDWLSRLVNGPC